jgi:hypothetical protein
MSVAVAGIIQLSSAIDLLKGGDKNFAQSLINFYNQKGRLSDKQASFIPKLLEKAEKELQPKPATQLENFSKVIEIFDNAKAKGYKKKIILRLGDEDYKIRLSEAPASGVNAGMVYVKVGEEYKGKITREGKWIYTGQADETLQQKLNEFSLSPKEEARKYGFRTGECCVCGRTLTDKNSIANGIGPICSSAFGL